MLEMVVLCYSNRQGAGKSRKERLRLPDQTISPRARCVVRVRFELHGRHSPIATRSWHWRKQNVDSLCLVRGADLDAPHAGRTQQVFLPRERLERCTRTNGLARNAWPASLTQSYSIRMISVRTKPVPPVPQPSSLEAAPHVPLAALTP